MRIFYHKSADAFARRLIPGIAVLILSAWGIASGGALMDALPELTTTAEAAELETKENSVKVNTFTDGEYTGTAAGFGGDITVKVTIKGGKITDIAIVSAEKETPSYLKRAKTVIDRILETQSTEVDVVSGATYSSNGIINAVKNALIKASGGTVTETTGSPGLGNTAQPGGTTTVEPFTDGTYQDGTYTGTAAGFGGNITVRVTIAGGKISAVDIVSAAGETPSYLAKAKAVISKVISKQSPNVDVVSGATYSSNGILNAIKKALKQAASGTTDTEPEKEDTEPDTTVKPDRTYTDGRYTGTGEGYGGNITVQVTILNQRIDAIDVMSAEGETPSFFTRARAVITSILNKQTTKNIDAVSGATYSSKGILDAVEQALDKAANANAPEQEPEPEPTPEPEPSEETETFTYTASAMCKDDGEENFEDYSMTIRFTVKQETKTETDENGKTTTTVIRTLAGLEVTDPTSSSSNWNWIKRAVNGTSSKAGILSQIQRDNSVSGIDVVTGATCSSRAIIQAAQSVEQQLNLGTTVK
ncbi:MAG: FMN-binding protein [Butyricicoccus sp.]